MGPETTWGSILWVLFIMGAVLIWMVGRKTDWFRQWREVEPDLAQRRERFQQLMNQRLGAALRSAEIDKLIIDEWETCPLEYRPYLYQVIRYAQLMEDTMVEEAMEKGVYPSRIVTQGAAIPPPPPMPRLPVVDIDEGEEIVRLAPENVVPIRSRWTTINGQLVKATG